MGHQSAEYELPSPAQELPEEVNVAGAAAADVQSELQGPQTTKCNTANGDAQDAVETVSPVEKAVSSADKSSSSRSSSYEEVEEEDDTAKRESCGLSGEVLDTTNESVEMEEEHIRDHANSNGRDHVVDDVCSKSSEIAQISPKVEENGESAGSSTTSSSGNGTAEAAAAAAETIDQTDVATKCRNGDSNIGTKEGVGVAPETNGTDHHKEGEDVNELLRNVPSDEAEKDSASWEETKDTSSSSTHIGDYLVTPAEDPIAGSCMEEDVIAVKHHDLQMRGASSTTVGYTVSTIVETFTNSVTYSKEDGFAGFEEENTSSSSNSKKKAPYFEDHHNNNNDKSMASSSLNSAEGESEVQRVLRLQTTHDLLCPVCGSCITKRVILRKRKRTSPSVVSVEKWVLLNEEEIQSQDTLEELHTSPTTTAAAVKEEATIVEPAAAAAADGHGYEYEEDWGCLACFTLFFRRVWRRAEEIPRASSSSAAEIPRLSSSSAAETQELPEDYHPPGLPQVEAETIVGVESAESVEVLPRVVEEDGSGHYYKNKCLPLLFPWRQIATTKLSRHPELLTPLLGDKEEEKTSIAAKDVVQMSIPTQSSREPLIDTLNKAPEQPNVEQPQKVTTAAAAHANDDDINCFSLFLPPFPWGETQQTAQSNRPEAVVAVADEQPPLRSNKEVQAIESDSITIGSLNVPLTSPTVTPITLCGEISAAEPPVDVLPPPAATNVCDEARGQGQIEESPRKASVNCLDLFLPAYPWEEASETTSLLEKTTAAAKQEKEINIQESLAWSTATTVSEDLLDPNVVFPAVNSTKKEVILPAVVLTPPEPHTKPAPENLVLSSCTQGIEDDEGKGMDKDAEHPTKKAGIKFSDAFHDPIYVTKIEDKITSAKVVNDHASKAGFNCLPLLLPPYPWEGATQVPVSQGGLVPNLVQEKVVAHISTSVQDEKALGAKLSWEEEQLDSKCLPLKLPTLAWRGGGGRSGTMTSSLARKEARLQSDVEDDELVEEEETPLVRKPPQIHDEKREVVAATTTESPKPVEQQEKAEAIGVEDTTPSSGGGTLAAASVGEEEHQEIKEEPCDQDLLPDEEIEAPDTAPSAAVVEEIEEHQPPQLVLPVEKLESVTAKKETIEAKESEDCSCGLLPALLFPAYPWEPSSRDFQTETREERDIKWPAVADRGIATHEVVSRDTHIESRITTTTTTYTKSADPTDEEHDTVDAIKVDTSVSYMDSSIQQWDDQPMQGTLVLDDGSPTIVVEPKTLHHFPPIYKFLDWDTPKKHHPSATSSHRPHELQASPPAPTYHWKDEAQQQPQEITEEEEVGVVSEVSTDLAEILQQASPNATKDQLNKSSFCECLPIAPSYSIFFRTATEDDQQLKEPLISAEAKSDTDSHDSSSVHVSLHQIHRQKEVKLPISQMPDGHSIFSDDHEPASCSCLPPFLFSRVSIGGSTLSHKDGLRQSLLDKRKADTTNTESPTTDISTSISDVSDETTTSVIMTTDDSVIEVHGSDAPSTLEAVTAAAEDLGMMTLTSTGSKVQEYLKSVVYGGLDVSLISLGVVASAAGGDAKTRTVLAMGLANLIFGSISFFHKVIELHKESPMRFRETVGQSFLLNGCLAFLSFLVFGSLPTLTFGFSFRQSNNHDYKMLATVVVSVISVVLLGCAKVFAKVTQQSYFATLSALIMTGVVAAVAGFYTGEYFSKLLAQFGFDT